MRLIALESWTVRIPLREPVRLGRMTIAHREYLVVRVEGGGEAGVSWGMTRDLPVADVLHRILAPAVAGSSLHEPTAIWQAAAATLPGRVADGTGMRALSLLDIAVWDLRGRVLGLGLHALLGGPRKEVAVMAVAGYPRGDREPEAAGEEAARLLDDGFSMVKVPRWPTTAATRTVLRRAAGARADASSLVVDAAWAWDDAATALGEIREWGDPRLAWLEDPLPAIRLDAYEALARRCPHPLAVGDECPDVALLGTHARAPWLSVLRFDATVAGGVTAAQRIAGLCELVGVPISLHVHLPLHVHLAAALPACRIVEAFGPDDEQSDPSHLLFADHVPIRDGSCAPSQDPGVGVDLDREFIERHSGGSHRRTVLGPSVAESAAGP